MKRLVYELLDHYGLDKSAVPFYRLNRKNRIVRYAPNYVARLLRKKSKRQLVFNQLVYLLSSVILAGRKYRYSKFKHIVNNINDYLNVIEVELQQTKINEITQLKQTGINLFAYAAEIMALDYEFENTTDINRIRELAELRQRKRMDFSNQVSVILSEGIHLHNGKASYTAIKVKAMSIKNDGEIYKLSLFLFTEIYAFSMEGFTKTLISRLRAFIDMFTTKVSAYKATLKGIEVEYVILRTKVRRKK